MSTAWLPVVVNGRYRLIGKLGQGSTGMVLLAEDQLQENRLLALKALGAAASASDAVALFKHEFRALKDLCHPHLAEVYDFGVVTSLDPWDAGPPGLPVRAGFYTMEHVPGEDFLSATSGLDFPELIDLAAQVCRGLEYIHARGLVHYDVKPSNLRVTKARQVKLLDFGLAGAGMKEGETRLKGTVFYMAPELFKGGRVDKRADLYSLGVLLYQVVARRLPFEGDTNIAVMRQHLDRAPEPPRRYRPDAPKALEEVILRLLEKDPHDRFAGANQVIDALDAASGTRHEREIAHAGASWLLSPTLVGREDELVRLSRALDEHVLSVRAAERAPSTSAVAIVTGEEGIGKRRLLSEFRTHAQLSEAEVIHVGCAEHGERPLGPFVEVLRHLVPRAAKEPTFADRFGRELSIVAPELVPPAASPGGGEIEPERDKVRLIGKLGEFLVETARRYPFVVTLSGLEWADEMSVDLLRYLARHLKQLGQKAGEAGPARDDWQGQLAGATLGAFEDFFIVGESAVLPPLLVVATCASDSLEGRPIEKALEDLRREAAVDEGRLPCLSSEHVRGMIASMTGHAEVPPRLLERVVEATGGNPLYVEETMKGLAEDGVVRIDEGAVRVDEARLPAAGGGVRDLVRARLARLDAPALRVLRVLACSRGEVSLDLLRRVAGSEEEVLDALGPLERRGVATRVVRDRIAWFGLAHGVVREAVLALLPPADAADLHDAIGAALEALYGGDRAEHAEELAHHLSRGRSPQRAIDDCLVAAGRARKAHANEKGIQFYQVALSAMPPADPRRLAAKEALAGLQALVGQYSGAVHTYSELLREVPSTDAEHSARLYRLAAETFSKKGDLEAATKWIDQGLELHGTGKNAEVARLLYQKAWVSVQRGECEKGIDLAHQALALAAALSSDEITASLLNVLGVAHLHLSKYHQAAEFLQRALAIHERLGNLQGAGDCLNNLAAMYGYAGDLPKALEQQRRVLALREKIGDIWGVVLCLSNLGVLYHEMGDNNTAMEFYRRGLEIREKIGMVHGMANSLLNIGNIHLERGQVGETMRCWERALAIYNAQGDLQGQTLALVNLAGVYVHIGTLEKAEEYAERANYLANKLKLSREQSSVARILAGIARGRKDYEGALRQIGKAFAIAEDTGSKSDVAQLSLLKGEVLYEKGDAEAAEREGDKLLGDGEGRRPSTMTGVHLLKARVRKDEAEKLRHLDAALKFAQEAESADLQWEVHYAFGRFYHELKDYANAGKFYKKAMDILKGLWATVPEEHRDGYLAVEKRQRLRTDVQRLKRDVSAPVHPSLAEEDDDAGPLLEAGDTVTTRRRLSTAVQLLKDENKNLQRLMDINKKLNSELDLARLLEFIMDVAVELTRAQRGYVILVNEKGVLTFEAARDVEKSAVPQPEREVSKGIAERVARTGEAVVASDASRDERFTMLDSVHDLKLLSVLCVPLRVKERTLGALYIENRAERAVFSDRDKELLEAFADQAAIAVENARLYQENLERQKELARSKGHVEQLNTQLSHLNTKLEEKVQAQGVELAEVKEVLEDKLRELTVKYNYDNIIARSPRMREVFMLLDRVTDSNLTVLIQGESGTGKELVAKAIHFNGPRKTRYFGAENCAALSDTLLESELFGYMRGAFTGAEKDKKGLFELAHSGTLFLDEVGDMSVEMQKKLLRVLETGELRRVGGKDTVHVDVRVISASNKDLKKLVEKGQFREDLYYRLNVFTVLLPPLRDRKEDIGLLVEHFLREFAKEVKQGQKKIDRGGMALLMEHNWPGNVRELRNVVMGVASLSDKEVLGVNDFVEKLPSMERRRREASILEPLSVEEYMKRFILTNQKTMTDTHMAKILGISRKTLWEKRKKWNLVK